VTGNRNPAPALGNALSERLSGVSERYLELRTTYASARENIVSAVQRLQMLDRLVPGIEIPQGPIDALSALDARVQELDASLSGIIGPNGVVESIQGAAQRIAERVDEADELLAKAEAGLAEAQVKLAETRAKIASTADTINTGISIGSVALFFVFLYLALLHWVLFRHASGMRRRQPAA
jgi:multidrug resistance efflux pump